MVLRIFQGIQHLVASSVDGLESDNVTVVLILFDWNTAAPVATYSVDNGRKLRFAARE